MPSLHFNLFSASLSVFGYSWLTFALKSLQISVMKIIQSSEVKGKELLSFVAVLHAVIYISMPFSPLSVLPLFSGVTFSLS